MLGRKNINGVSAPLFFRHRTIQPFLGRKLPEIGQETNSVNLISRVMFICLVKIERLKEFISE